MANDLNLCQFIGNLGADPDSRALPNNTPVTRIRIACNWKSGDKEGVEWVTAVAFGKLADVMSQYLRKGSKVYVAGKMRTRKWQDRSGADRYTTEIIVSDMQMLDSRSDSNQGTHSLAPAYGASASNQEPDDGFSDDIPF